MLGGAHGAGGGIAPTAGAFLSVPAAAVRRTEALPRQLGLIATGATLIGTIIGSGIFRAPSAVARHLPAGGPFLIAWVVGGLVAVTGAMAFAELAATLPYTGGRYIFLREGIAPPIAFAFAWLSSALLHPVSDGALALVFASYAGTVVPPLAGHDHLVATFTVLALAVLNYRSTRSSAQQLVVTSAAKMIALLVMGLILLSAAGAEPVAASAVPGTPSLHAFGLALITVMWTYSGWGSITYMVGEVRRPDRTMPLVLTGSLLCVLGLFVLVNAGYLHVLGTAAIGGTTTVASDAMEAVAGPGGRVLVGVVVMVAVLGALNASTLMLPRLMFAMGHDTPGLRWLARVHPRFRTPHLAVVVSAVLTVVYMHNHDFEQLAATFIVGTWPFDVLCVVALFRLRRRRDLAHPVRMPGFPGLPIVFMLAVTALVANAVWTQPVTALEGAGLFAAGIPLYYLLRRWQRPAPHAT